MIALMIKSIKNKGLEVFWNNSLKSIPKESLPQRDALGMG